MAVSAFQVKFTDGGICTSHTGARPGGMDPAEVIFTSNMLFRGKISALFAVLSVAVFERGSFWSFSCYYCLKSARKPASLGLSGWAKRVGGRATGRG